VGVAVKHRQLACQVGVFIEHPPENTMASFNFTSAVLDEGMVLTFGSWFCIANDRGGFNSYLLKPGSRRHLLQHSTTTLTTSPMISADFDFPI
jgi:hypothetical protein